VRHLDRAAADVKCRTREALDAEQIEAYARPDHVNYSVNRADLVKVYALDRDVVDARLGLCESREDFRRALLDGVGQTRAAYDLVYVREMSVVMLLFRQADDGARRVDAGAFNLLEVDFVAREVEQRELLLESARIRAGADECAERHVAADASEAVEVKRPHRTP